MIKDLDNFYLEKEEPLKSCMLALRDIIMSLDKNITTSWKYKLPFFCYKKKMFCYIWIDKKTKFPYIGIVEGQRIEHFALDQGNRKQIKALHINPNKDFPDYIEEILNEALDLYKNGIIKIKT